MKTILYRNFVCPQGIHVTHVIIDGANDIEDNDEILDSEEFIKELFPDIYSKKPQKGILDPEYVAEVYWQIYLQKRNTWTQEMDLRSGRSPWHPWF